MRILYHHRTRSRDGQRVHIDGLIGALRRAGHEVLEVGPPLEEPGGDATVVRTPPRWLRPVREAAETAYNAKEILQLRSAVRAFRPDALYSRHALFGCAPDWAGVRPWIVEVNAPLAWERAHYGGLTLRRFAEGLETRTLNRADRVIVVTQVMADHLVDQGVRRELLEVHPNGLEPDRLAAAAAALAGGRRAALGLEGRTVLGFVGFVRDWNRLDASYAALERHRDAVLLIVGDGPDRPRLLSEAERRGVAEQVRFVGAVPSSEVVEYVATFDVAILPEATAYASPLKLLDYLAAARAVLAPDRPNLREILTHDVNARLFDPDQPDAFDGALEGLLADPQARERLGTAARATIDRLGLTWDHNAQRVVADFRALGAVESTS